MQLGALRFLIPDEGSITTSTVVMMDSDDTDKFLSLPEVLDKTKQQIMDDIKVTISLVCCKSLHWIFSPTPLSVKSGQDRISM